MPNFPQAPTPVLLGSEWDWNVVEGKQKLTEVKHYGYTVDLFGSLGVSSIYRNKLLR